MPYQKSDFGEIGKAAGGPICPANSQLSGQLSNHNVVPVNAAELAVRARESSERARSAALDLLDSLQSAGSDVSCAKTPVRVGLNGTIQDAIDASEHTLKLLAELRAYLLG